MNMYKRLRNLLWISLAAAFIAVPIPALAATGVKVTNTAGMGVPGYNDGTVEEAQFHYPYGLTSDKNGGIIIVDCYNNKIRLLKDDKVITLAGYSSYTQADGLPMGGLMDGDALKADFNHPRDAVVDSKGNIIISDSENNVIRIMMDDKLYTLAGAATAGYTDGQGEKARFHLPSGMAIDNNDNIYVADTLNNVIRKITPKGEVSTYAGKACEEGGYCDAMATESLFNEPSDVAIDSSGAIYVLDSGNQLIRKIENGKVSTIAGTATDKISETSYSKGGFQNGTTDQAAFNFPMGIDVALDGTIFIADTYNHRIRVIKKDGSVGTLAGNGIPGWVDGYADTAEFNGPIDVLYDNGTLYISDAWNNVIRSMKVDLKKLNFVRDREELKGSYHFDKVTENIQVWYEGSRISLTKAKAYKEWDTIYVPLQEVMKAWGAKVKWVKKNKKLSVTGKGFHHVFEIGKENTVLENGKAYIETGSLGNITNLRLEWFPEYNALVIEKHN